MSLERNHEGTKLLQRSSSEMVPGAKNHGAIPKQRTLVGTFFVAGLYSASEKLDWLCYFIAGTCLHLPPLISCWVCGPLYPPVQWLILWGLKEAEHESNYSHHLAWNVICMHL